MKNKLEQNRYFQFLFFKLYHLIFSEKFNKKIKFNFDKSKLRINLIQSSIKKNNYKKYLEIGCDQNQIFDKIDIDKKVGVDPVSGGNFRGTSDQFFKKNDEVFDCIFIDGLHEYNQVRKDIVNSLKFLSDNGVIFLHDCLPDSISKQYVPRCRYSWNGDVWKAIVEVRTWDDYDVCTSLIDQGIAIIKKRKNQDKLNLKVKNFKKLSFKFFYENHIKIMRIKNYEDSIKFI
jgi:hypothetical protein